MPTPSDTNAATLFTTVCHEHVITPTGLVLHADNGGLMNGATMVSTVKRLGVIPSFSRPRVSDDNPYSEALFRTCTYCPAFPLQPFREVEAARAGVTAFVAWYHHHHQHSAIQCVTPDDRDIRAGTSLHRWWTFERSNRAVHGSAGGREAQ